MKSLFFRTIFVGFAIILISGLAAGQEAGVLNSFDSGLEGWSTGTGTGVVTVSQSGGALFADYTGGTGARNVYGWPSYHGGSGAGNYDMTGMDSIEFDMSGTSTSATTAIQIFSQIGASWTWFAPLTVSVTMDGTIRTYSCPLDSLTDEERASMRRLGIKIMGDDNDFDLYIYETRCVGDGWDERTWDFTSSSPDSGLQGAFVNWDQTAVSGNTGTADQVGLSQNPSAGDDGVLEWVDLAGEGGASVAVFNGYGGGSSSSGWNYSYIDLTGYDYLEVTLAAAASPLNPSVTYGLSIYTQSDPSWAVRNDFEVNEFSPDGNFYKAYADLSTFSGEKRRVITIGVNLMEHDDDLTVQVDQIRAFKGVPATPMPTSTPVNTATPSSGISDKVWEIYY